MVGVRKTSLAITIIGCLAVLVVLTKPRPKWGAGTVGRHVPTAHSPSGSATARPSHTPPTGKKAPPAPSFRADAGSATADDPASRWKKHGRSAVLRCRA